MSGQKKERPPIELRPAVFGQMVRSLIEAERLSHEALDIDGADLPAPKRIAMLREALERVNAEAKAGDAATEPGWEPPEDGEASK